MKPTLQKAMEAYGGQTLWKQATAIQATFSANGLAFKIKQRPPFREAELWMEVHRPYSRISPIGKDPEVVGVLDGDTVRLETKAGEVLAKRHNPRRCFPGGRQLLYWDDLDMAYFANYAMWNYLTLPALLLRPEIQWVEEKEGVLDATFPDAIPTHSRKQRFRFGPETGRLLQHDYTSEVISSLATAAHVVHAHEDEGPWVYTSQRKVTPRSWSGKPLGWPTLIAIEIHHLEIHESLLPELGHTAD